MGSKRESNFVGSCRLLWVLIILSIPVILFSQARPAFTVNGVRAVNGTTLPICHGNRIAFENTTLTYETIRWRFDNGNPTQASSQQVQVRFDVLGIGKAVLIRTDFDGRVDSTWVFFSITNVFPVSSFDYNPKTLECGSLPFQFTDGSSGNGLGFVWNFGDGTSSTNRNPIHKFNKAIGATGNTSYSVRQIVTNSGGCKDTSVVQITVKNIPDISINSADPMVNFGPFNGIETFRYCNNVPFYTFQFRNISSTISAINGYTIKWGDGTPDTSFATWPGNVNINHTFPQGNSTMTVYVSGSNGCNNEKSYNVFVGSTPAGGFASPGNTEVCAPDSLKFVISGTANNPIGTIYTVTINDGTPIQSFNHPAPDTVSHWFTKSSCGFSSSNGPNTFTNSFFSLLNIENPCGATSVNVIPIYVSGKPNPAAAISPGRNICINVPAQIGNAGDFGGRIMATGGGGSVCENKGKLVWEIFPSTGYSLSGGSLGNRNNRPVSGLDWTPGTETFNITFTQPGIYTVMQYMWNERCGLDSSELEICVRTPPAASFTMDKNEACAPDTLSLTNTSPIGACGGETYQWTIRYTDPTSCGGSGSYTYINGTAANSTNPQISFGEAGLYIIELRVSTRASGCTPALFTDTFTVRQKPIVSINPLGRICTANTLSPAANVNTCYQNQGIIYEWAFTGGTPASSGSLNPGAVFYNTQGNFPIVLKVTNDCGTTEANSQAIVGGRPDANAGPDRTACSNEPVNIGMTGFTGVVYSWTPLRGLSNATIPNPTVNYPFYGPAADTTFQYVLTADAGVNCRSTDTVLVTIKRGPLLTVNPTNPSVCIGGSVTLTANGADTYIWSPAAGLNDTQGAVVIASPVNTTLYTVTGSLANNCRATANGIRIVVHPDALADIKPSPLVGCTPFAITPAVINLTAYPDRNSIYRWYANNGLIGTGATFPGYTLSNSDDSIIIKLVTISKFGCVNDSASAKFKTISNPSPSFVLSDTVGCGPLNILVTNTTPQQQRYTFRWDFGNGQTSNNPQPGTILFAVNPNRGDTIYTVKLSATGGCDTFTVEHKIRVRARPRAIFTPDKAEGCSPFTVTLNNNSAGSNAIFVWDFGDGSSLQPADFSSVRHTYFTGRLDTFRIRLYGTNDCGTDTARFNLVVNPNRIRLDFAVNGGDLNGCAPHTVNFFNNTIGANVFFWNFGDGSPVFITNKGFDTVRHTFSDTGRFVVTLFASNGCSDTTSVEIINVVKGPRVSFTLNPTVICLNQPFTLSNTSDAGLAWNWDFGDGTSSTLRDPLKNYTAAGSYRIVLRGSRQFAQGFNCTDSVVANLIVNAPTGNWRYRGGYYCPGQPAFFEVTNSNATRYKFFFGNGDSVVTASPSVSYVYPSPGAYMPRVELLYQGCTITLVGPDTIRMDKRQTGFTVQRQQFCGSTRVNFTDTSSAFFGIRQWSWLFGDGTTSTLQNPVKVFTQSGTYAITLRVTGNSGCIDTTTRQVTIAVEQLPVISITGDSNACAGQPARFAAFDAANTTAVFDWQKTAGGNQTGNEIFTTWPQSGTYALRLIGRTAFGCADTATRSVRVNPTPVVNAGRDVTICRGQQIQLNATAPGSLLWTPQQGLSCNTCPNPIANPNFTTEYFVTNTNTFGCTGIDSMLVKVAQPFTLNVVPNDTICASRNESAQLFASNAIRYQWTPTVGLNANNIPNPVARPASTTTYRVVGFDVENCFTDTGYVTVGVGYNPTVSLPAGSLVVAGTQVTLTPALTGGPFARYTWTPNRDLSCNNCPGPVATINNTILYKLEVETIYGCIATDTVGYTVLCQKDQVFIPNAFSPDGDGVNDILMVRGKGVSTVKSFRIFNRYGQVVFEKQNFSANDPSAGWDGRVNGVPASPDVYVFTAEVLCTAGANYTYKGNIALFR